LRRLANFAAFSPECAKPIQELFGRFRSIARGRDILKNGDDADEIFVLLRGWAARYLVLPSGERQITEFLLPGDVFPIPVGPIGKMDHAIGALTTCHVVSTPAKVFNDRVLHDPKMAKAFWWITIADKGVLRAWVVNVGARSGYSRIAHMFCELAARLEMVGLSDGSSFAFPLTQQDVSDAQGLTSVHINRMVQQLRANDLIEWRDKRVTILDREGLRQVAEFDPAYLNPGGRPPQTST